MSQEDLMASSRTPIWWVGAEIHHQTIAPNVPHKDDVLSSSTDTENAQAFDVALVNVYTSPTKGFESVTNWGRNFKDSMPAPPSPRMDSCIVSSSERMSHGLDMGKRTSPTLECPEKTTSKNDGEQLSTLLEDSDSSPSKQE